MISQQRLQALDGSRAIRMRKHGKHVHAKIGSGSDYDLFLAGARGMAAEGLQTVASNYDLDETIKRLESAIKAKGMVLFAPADLPL
jgi:hypothetical protein